ncbi:alpha/beta hydrolase family protein [Amycolatopsis jejuensis]|uniref:alpha/beta hydrolase family protein n=1 Tax=Amycolatopsis jejuensis TaxID=330084 RepID=UPI000525DBD7|nr:alpha/beta hydrolase [Amycolatopsis jejuensis]
MRELRVGYPALPGPADQASAAALRQFTPLRLAAYGVEAGDALRLLELVGEGASWQATAVALAEGVLDRAGIEWLSTRARNHHLHRASALLRISRVMDLENDENRREAYLRAAELFTESRADDARYERVDLDGGLAAWVIRPRPEAPVVLVHGGVDGWAMDWEGLALSFVDEGLTALVIDGPGQGETRFRHEHYLSPDWLGAYQPVVDHLTRLAGPHRIAAAGNSMAAGMVLQIAERYPVFSAVSSNGPLLRLSDHLQRPSYARKLATFCGWSGVSAEVVRKTFETVDLPSRMDLRCPVQLLQGSADPMVPVADGEEVLERISAPDKQMVLFDRGEHVINRYPGDKHALQASWIAHHLA